MTDGQRRIVGVWVVVLVCCGLLVGSSVWGAGAPGRAERAAPPAPPVIGSCLRSLDELEVVPCTEDHVGEIVRSWTGKAPADDLDPELYPVEHFPREDAEIYCFPALDAHYNGTERLVITPGIEWQTSMVPVSSRIVRGPSGPSVQDWSWTACVFTVMDGLGREVPVRAPLSELTGNPLALPESTRSCGRPTEDGWAQWEPCSSPHRTETVAFAAITLSGDDLSQVVRTLAPDGSPVDSDAGPLTLDLPDAEQQCRTLVESYLGAPLTAHNDDLDAVLTQLMPYYDFDESQSSSGVLTGVSAECHVTVTGDRDLTGSVAGIGTAPLPFD